MDFSLITAVVHCVHNHALDFSLITDVTVSNFNSRCCLISWNYGKGQFDSVIAWGI